MAPPRNLAGIRRGHPKAVAEKLAPPHPLHRTLLVVHSLPQLRVLLPQRDQLPAPPLCLARQDEELLKLIPDTHRGYKVDVEVTGEFRSRDTMR